MQKYADVVKILKEAFSYSLSFERITLFFVAALPLIAYVTVFFQPLSQILTIYEKAKDFPLDQFNTNVKLLILGLFLFSALAVLLQLYFKAAITRNCYANKHLKKESIYKSLAIVFKSFTDILLATIALMALSALLGLLEIVPSIGDVLIPILAMILTILFFFYIQAIIVNNHSWLAGLRASIDFVREKWMTLLFVISLFVLDIILVFITTLPLIILFLMLLGAVPNPATLGEDILPYIEFAKANFTITFIAILITAFLTGFVYVFQESSKTLYYSSAINHKKRKRG